MKHKKKKRDHSAYYFMLPAFIIYFSVIVFPVGYSIYISLFDGKGLEGREFCGINNYINLFKDNTFLQALRNNILWIILSVVITTICALLLAELLNRPFRGRTFFRTLFYFPTIIAGISVAIIWRWIYNPNIGFINEFFNALGLDFSQEWLSNPKTAIYAVFVASLWKNVGEAMIIFLAGLQSVSPDVLEAASIDGANGTKRFLFVTVPMLKNTFIIVIVVVFMEAAKVYDIVKGLTDGGPNHSTEMFATYMYSQSFEYNNIGYGTAVAIMMVIIMLVATIPYLIITLKKEE